MEYALRPAHRPDLRTILTWVETPELLKLWGGPTLSFPPEIDRTWCEIEATPENTFCLVDQTGRTVGFGQTLSREPDAIHLGRIIVSEVDRGKGVGRLLCEQLIRVASEQYQVRRFTLNVYKYNIPALSLYTSLGFEMISEDRESNSCLLCLKRETTRITHPSLERPHEVCDDNSGTDSA